MLGYHSDPASVLAGSDVFTLGTAPRGLPISLLEAMALGLPPVVTAVGANAVGVADKVVTDGVTGVVVEPGRPDLLAGAYVRLAHDDRDLRRRLGDAAAERAAELRHSTDRAPSRRAMWPSPGGSTLGSHPPVVIMSRWAGR